MNFSENVLFFCHIIGTLWQQRRKLLSSAFHFDILTDFVRVFHNETIHLVQNLEKIVETEKVIDVVPLINKFALDSINGK